MINIRGCCRRMDWVCDWSVSLWLGEEEPVWKPSDRLYICPIRWHHGRSCGGSGRACRTHPAEVRGRGGESSILLPAKANKLTANHSAHFPDIHVHVAGQARASDFLSTYTKQPTVGCSIGPSTTNVSGSLDFYGKISAEGRQPKYFGVTCHHVAFPPSRSAGGRESVV